MCVCACVCVCVFGDVYGCVCVRVWNAWDACAGACAGACGDEACYRMLSVGAYGTNAEKLR